MSEKAYNQNNVKYIDKTNNIIKIMPEYIKAYLYSIENSILPKTRYSYIYDLKLFFEFLVSQNPSLNKISDISIDYLDNLNYDDFTEYTHYLVDTVADTTRARRLASLQKFFSYMYKRKLITSNNDFNYIDRPKMKKKTIVYMEKDEINAVLDNIENGYSLTEKHKKRIEKQSVRDMAIISLILGTGIRVSECVSLDIKDVNLNNNSIHVFRKGYKEMTLYFSDEVCANLSLYLEERKMIDVYKEDEDALFISRNHRRITARAVENLVRKYAGENVVGNKHITAHKLRSSFGTGLYRATSDLYLTSTVLGHTSMQTTRDYYAAQSEEALKKASDVKLW